MSGVRFEGEPDDSFADEIEGLTSRDREGAVVVATSRNRDKAE